jgi:hypothetical protein
MGLRNWVKRLERASREEFIEIPQRDGTTARFPASAGMEAYMNFFERMGAGEDAPPEHPLLVAARNSSDPYWSEGIYAVNDPEEWVKPIEDLSEP